MTLQPQPLSREKPQLRPRDMRREPSPETLLPAHPIPPNRTHALERHQLRVKRANRGGERPNAFVSAAVPIPSAR